MSLPYGVQFWCFNWFFGGLKCISGLLYNLSFFSMQKGWNNFTYYAALYFMTWITFGFISVSIMYLLMLFKVIIYVIKLSWTTWSVFLIAICKLWFYICYYGTDMRCLENILLSVWEIKSYPRNLVFQGLTLIWHVAIAIVLHALSISSCPICPFFLGHLGQYCPFRVSIIVILPKYLELHVILTKYL